MNNLVWVVDSGRFRVTPVHRVRSEVIAKRAVTGMPPQEEESPVAFIIKELMRPATEKKGEKPSPPSVSEAQIHTLSQIESAFEVDLVVVSESQWGSMEIVLLGGEATVPRYRMVYHAAPSADRPIQIIRVRGSRHYLIEASTAYPNLGDGMPHRIQWIRDAEGEMRVLVDGREVLSTVETFYQEDFTGLALMNRGGVYEWGPIKVLEVPTQKD